MKTNSLQKQYLKIDKLIMNMIANVCIPQQNANMAGEIRGINPN